MKHNFVYKSTMAGLLATCATSALAVDVGVNTTLSAATPPAQNFTADVTLTVDTSGNAVDMTTNDITTATTGTGTINFTTGGNTFTANNIGTATHMLKQVTVGSGANINMTKAGADMYTQKLDLNTSNATNNTFVSTGGTIRVGDGAAGSDMTVAGTASLTDTTVTLDAGEVMLIDGNNADLTLAGSTTVNTGIKVKAGVTGATINASGSANTGTLELTDNTAALNLTGTAQTGAVTLGSGSVLNVNAANTASLGAVDGSAASTGTLNFATTDYTLKNAVGSTNSLSEVEVTGAITLTAGANVTADTVNFAGDGTIDVANAAITGNITTDTNNEGTLNFTGTGSVVGSIGGVGALLKEVNYTGTSALGTSVFATTTTIGGGTTTAVADSTVTGAMVVNGGSKLDLSSHTLNIAGTGTLDVSGASTIGTTINSATDFGNVASAGVSTVAADTTLAINVADNSGVKDGDSFTIINSTGGTGIAGLTVSDNSNLFNFTQTGAGVEDLVVAASVAATFDTDAAGTVAAGLGTALQADLTAGNFSTGLAGSLNTLAGLSADERKAMMAKMTPEVNGASVEAAFDNQNRIYSTISERLKTAEEEGLWVSTSFVTKDKDTTKGIGGYDADATSITVGADKKSEDARVGMAFTYTQTDIEGKNALNGNDTDVDSYNLTFYGTQELPQSVMLEGKATIGKSDYDSKRNLSAIGAGIAKGKYDGTTYGLEANVSKVYDVDGVAVRPIAGLAFNRISLDDFEEKGSTANLRVDSESFESLKSKVGVEVELASVNLNEKWTMKPEVHGFWSHEFIDESYDRTAVLTGGSTSFKTNGTDAESDVFTIGAGVNLASTDNWKVGVAYDAELASDSSAHAARVVVSKKF